MKPTRLEWWLVQRLTPIIPKALRRRCGRYWWTEADIAEAHRRATEIGRWMRGDQQ